MQEARNSLERTRQHPQIELECQPEAAYLGAFRSEQRVAQEGAWNLTEDGRRESAQKQQHGGRVLDLLPDRSGGTA